MPFGGKTYDPVLDAARLGTQLQRVKALMADGQWRTLKQIQTHVGGTEAAVSARLRDFRKAKFGGHTVERRRVGQSGLFEYRLVLTKLSSALERLKKLMKKKTV